MGTNKREENRTLETAEENMIDCLGDICPLPMMKFQQIEGAIKNGKPLKIVTDHSCASENLIHYCEERGYPFYVVEPIPGIWEIFVNVSAEKNPPED